MAEWKELQDLDFKITKAIVQLQQEIMAAGTRAEVRVGELGKN